MAAPLQDSANQVEDELDCVCASITVTTQPTVMCVSRRSVWDRNTADSSSSTSHVNTILTLMKEGDVTGDEDYVCQPQLVISLSAIGAQFRL